MKVIITSKNIKTNDYMKDTVEKKMQKLSKYFSDDFHIFHTTQQKVIRRNPFE